MSIKAFIFDLDGTLIDTEKIYRRAWPAAVREMGYEMSDELFLSFRSLGRPFVYDKFREAFGEDFDYDKARRLRKPIFDEIVKNEGISLKPGALELLGFLRERGIVTAVATATDGARAHDYMEMVGLNDYVDKLISARMVEEGKPSPMVYEYACSELGRSPSECVAVEDAPNGIKSAHAAGLRVIMVPDLTGPDEELLPLLWKRMDSLFEIETYLEKYATF